MKPLDRLSWDTVIVDPETGSPTPFFILLWQNLLTKVESIELPDNPANGDTLTLTYNSERRKWIGS